MFLMDRTAGTNTDTESCDDKKGENWIWISTDDVACVSSCIIMQFVRGSNSDDVDCVSSCILMHFVRGSCYIFSSLSKCFVIIKKGEIVYLNSYLLMITKQMDVTNTFCRDPFQKCHQTGLWI